MGYPAAVWRMPHAQELNLLISIQDGIRQQIADLENLPACFVIHPFESPSSGESYILEGDVLITFSEDMQLLRLTNRLGEEQPAVQQLFDRAKQLSAQDEVKPVVWNGLSRRSETDPASRAHYTQAVEKAVEEIRAGNFMKLVLSRTKPGHYSKDFRPFQAFLRLCSAYASAFVSLVNLPDRGEQWMGATPETLVSVSADGIFKTTSLAGTQSIKNAEGDLIPPKKVLWGQKEIEEQALVSRYIIECFKKIRLREYLETGPKTIRAGNLYHLRTDFEVQMKEVNFAELGTVMLKLLHPTSAVCGMPRESARTFIKNIEGFDRSFYSGFLGPVQMAGESALFVNLRCVRLSEGTATFFAGAGITEDSDPMREWEETEMKCETLLSVLT
ncbi:isochorismate synthase [Arundinibacter roseus]|uniref:isochorismate synthase n=1 Tax=Arundinibacter roseus TaxID=2070510 RepID=A0A4R4KDS7_9BACT|nr:isochorismate synthase [Arundinibacter roseus]